MSDWEWASREDKMLALVMFRSPRWLRVVRWVAVHLPGPLGRAYDRLDRYTCERALRELRERKARRVPQ